MGKNSRQRRAEKQRRQQRRSNGSRPGASGPDRRSMYDDVACDCIACQAERLDSTSGSRSTRWSELESVLIEAIGRAWSIGWQPTEVVRQIERTITPVKAARSIVATAIAAHAVVSNGGTEVHQRWASQLDVVKRQENDPSRGWVERFAGSSAVDDPLQLLVDVCSQLAGLGPLLVLLPYPGISDAEVASWSDLVGWRLGESFGHGDRDPVLDKVRALLAKAEATEFAAEAEAFTAKANELIIRHAFDEAALRGRAGVSYSAEVGARRILLVEPYAKQHGLLLAQVAAAADARCVLESDWAMATVVGPQRELAGIETLHTSLMVQAQAAFNEVAVSASAGSRVRSRGYRSSFLTSFASRVGHRLQAQRTEATADAPGTVLPVLAADRAAVAQRYEELFGGSVKSVSFDASDGAGWAAGASAADRARLGADQVDHPSGSRALAQTE